MVRTKPVAKEQHTGRLSNNSWIAGVGSSIIASIILAYVGTFIGAPPAVTLIAAAFFGTLIIGIVQLGFVIAILSKVSKNPENIVARMIKQSETESGRSELARTTFPGLLTLAIQKELDESFFARERPLWVYDLLALKPDFSPLNRYVEWMLLIVLIAFVATSALLAAAFVSSVINVGSIAGLNTFCCFVIPAFAAAGLLAVGVGIFATSVVRRLLIYYAQMGTGQKPKAG